MVKILTDHISPPIPDRRGDWCATAEGYDLGDPHGEGATEAQAVADLMNNWCRERGADAHPVLSECLICRSLNGEGCAAETPKPKTGANRVDSTSVQ